MGVPARKLGFVSGLLLLGVFVGIGIGVGIGGPLGLGAFLLISCASFALLLLREVRRPGVIPEPQYNGGTASLPTGCTATDAGCVNNGGSHLCLGRRGHETWHECGCGYAWPLDAEVEI